MLILSATVHDRIHGPSVQHHFASNFTTPKRQCLASNSTSCWTQEMISYLFEARAELTRSYLDIFLGDDVSMNPDVNMCLWLVLVWVVRVGGFYLLEKVSSKRNSSWIFLKHVAEFQWALVVKRAAGIKMAAGRSIWHGLQARGTFGGRILRWTWCWGRSTRICFHIVGDKLIIPIVGVYIPIIRIPVIEGGMSLSPI